MGTHMGHVLTLANSIIGVSVLAMPFCFRQCGILLSVLMLLLSSYISRLACHHLMKSAIAERMKNFEMLAFRAFGSTGKLIVELCIIGFMLGTCVAFFVVIGDLGPNILGPILGLEHPSALRPSVLIGTAVFVVLPLGLLRNVDSLNGICAVSLAFYGVLVLKVSGIAMRFFEVFLESATNLFGSEIWDKVFYWRPAGILRCIPIFSMALSCQTQLFEVFGSLPTTPLDRANAVVKSAVNLTTFLYIAVGFFGYIAYADMFLTGNVMMNFSSGASSDIIKICFLFSVAVSFPLVIFPCRASIYSFWYSKVQHSYEGIGSSHIPETRFQCITLVIVTVSLVIGLLIPNIEIVLGLVGSTLGVFICVITPGLIFTTVSQKRNNERLAAKMLVGTGAIIMILGTYANLYATEETLTAPDHEARVDSFVNAEPPRELQGGSLGAVNSEDINSVLKKLKKEERKVEKVESPIQIEKFKLPNAIDKVEGEKNVSPGLFSDHNPQPKVEEGPKPQPIAPEPPEEPQKKIPINIPETLENLESQKKVKNDAAMGSEIKKLAVDLVTPDVIKKAVGVSGIIERMAASKKSVDPVQPVPPDDKPRNIKEVETDQKAKTLELVKNEKAIERAPLEKVAKPSGNSEIEKSVNSMNAIPDEREQEKEKFEAKLSPGLENEIDKNHANLTLNIEPAKKDNFSVSMAQGLPLPLAIKGLDKKKFVNSEGVKIGREILVKSAEIERREKRDLEVSEAEKVEEKQLVNDESDAETAGVGDIRKRDLVLLSSVPEEDRNEKADEKLIDSKPNSQIFDDSSSSLQTSNISGISLQDPPQVPNDFANKEKIPIKSTINSYPRKTYEHNYADDHQEKGNSKDEEECPKTTVESNNQNGKKETTTPLVKDLRKLSNQNSMLNDEASFPDLKNHISSIHELISKQKK